MDEELKAAIEKIRLAASEAGKYSAMYCTSGMESQRFADAGFNMVRCTANDTVKVALTEYNLTDFGDK